MTKRQNDRKTDSLCCEALLVKMNDIINGNLKNDLQQILTSTLSISDAQTSNKYTTTNRIGIYTKDHERLGGGGQGHQT